MAVARPSRAGGRNQLPVVTLCVTRETLFLPTPYVAVYRVKEQTIEVMRIYHSAQDRP